MKHILSVDRRLVGAATACCRQFFSKLLNPGNSIRTDVSSPPWAAKPDKTLLKDKDLMDSRVCRCVLSVVCCTLVLALGRSAAGQQSPSAASLTVNDVIKMVQVKLADDLIIAQVKRSGKPLALSTDDLVRLKAAGASDDVIRAMINPQQGVTPTSPVTATRPEESDAQTLLAALVTQESEGRAILASFKKTDGQSSEVNRVPMYRMAFEATVQFTKDCKWLREPFSGLRFKTRDAPKSANGRDFNWNDFYEASQYPGVVVKSGQTAGLAGTLTFVKSEKGWNLNSTLDAKVVSEPDKSGAPLSRSTARNAPPPTSNSPEPTNPSSTAPAVFVSKSDGSRIPLAWQRGTGKYLFGARKVVELEGASAGSRISLPADALLISAPARAPLGWDRRMGEISNQCSVYVFEVAKGKRIAKIKDGISCTTEPFGSSDEVLKVVIKSELPPGEYALGPADPKYPGAGAPIEILPFGIDPGGATTPRPVPQPPSTSGSDGADTRNAAPSAKRTSINGVVLTAAEEEWVRFIAAKVRPALPGGLDAQVTLVARSTWWSLKEGVLNLQKPLEHSSCAVPAAGTTKAHNEPLAPLQICSGKVWQVGIAAVQVNNFTDAQVLAGISKLLPDRSVAQVLAEAATFAGFDPGSDTGAKIVSSTGSLQRSWLLRHPILGSWFVEKNVTPECITGEKPWCFGADWSQSKDYASTKEAALKSISDLEAAFKQMAR